MAEEKKETKTEENSKEKELIVPLRRKFLRTHRHKRVPKAVKALKKFIARHMKFRDDDLRKIKIDKYLNEEMWFRGIKNPPAKIKVKAKREGENIIVELSELSEKAKWKKTKEEKIEKEMKKVAEEKKKAEEAAKKAAEKEAKPKEEESEEEKKEKAEKKEAVEEAAMKQAEEKHKEAKATQKAVTKQKMKQPKHQFRKALGK